MNKRTAGAPLFLDPVCMYVYVYICPQKFLNCRLWVYTQKYVACAALLTLPPTFTGEFLTTQIAGELLRHALVQGKPKDNNTEALVELYY